MAPSEYEDGNRPAKIFRNLNDCMDLNTVKRWGKIIRNIGSIQLATSLGGLCFARTSKTSKKVKQKLDRDKYVSVRSLAKQLNVFKSSMYRILNGSLKRHAYKTLIKTKHIN